MSELWLPAILIIGGSFLASITQLRGKFTISLFGLLVMLIGRCGTDALERIIRQKGVRKSDPILFNFWRFLWLAIVGTIMSVGIALARGMGKELYLLIKSTTISALPWILLTMSFVFLFNTFFHKAINTGAVSKVSMVVNFQIVLGIPITLIGNLIKPGIFGKISSEALVWIVRGAGGIFITYGVIRLRK